MNSTITAEITAEQFEREYAKRCNITVDELRAKGRVVVICHCDYEECKGFGSLPREIATDPYLGHKIVLP